MFIRLKIYSTVSNVTSILLSSMTGCDEVRASNHLTGKENLEQVFPEESSTLLDGTAFTVFNNDSELINASIPQEDNEQPGHIIVVPVIKPNHNAAGTCWPR